MSWVFKGEEELAGGEGDERMLQEVSVCEKGQRSVQAEDSTRRRGRLERRELTMGDWWESPTGAGSARASSVLLSCSDFTQKCTRDFEGFSAAEAQRLGGKESGYWPLLVPRE